MQRDRVLLVERLRNRLPEMQRAILARIGALPGGPETQAQEYVDGLRGTIAATLEYALDALEQGPDWTEPPPAAALNQARLAARHGVSLDTVLRRYYAGDRVLADFAMELADGLPGTLQREIQQMQSKPVDALMEAVSSAYQAEVARLSRSSSGRLTERVKRMLLGELFGGAAIPYEFRGWHVAMISNDRNFGETARTVAKSLGTRVLVVEGLAGAISAWIGQREPLSVEEVTRSLLNGGGRLVASVGVGEARLGMDGWRLSYHEAAAALGAKAQNQPVVVRCREVVLAAAVMRDPALTEALLGAYARPLDEGRRESGADFRKTLQAYLSTGQNARAAAALLDVDRHTVQRRIRSIEILLGQPLESCHAEVRVALEVEEILTAGQDLLRAR